MKLNAIRCPRCKEIIYSRTVHDYHSCHCGAVTIDGGLEYCHCGWIESVPMPKVITIDIKTNPTTLYQDWNYMTNKLGWIKIRRNGKYLYFRSLRKFVK